MQEIILVYQFFSTYFANTALEDKLQKPGPLFNFARPGQWTGPSNGIILRTLSVTFCPKYVEKPIFNKCLNPFDKTPVLNMRILPNITFKPKVINVKITKYFIELSARKLCTRQDKKMGGSPCCCSVDFNCSLKSDSHLPKTFCVLCFLFHLKSPLRSQDI